jgi:hypothetical protein
MDGTQLASLGDGPQHYLLWTIIAIVSSHHVGWVPSREQRVVVACNVIDFTVRQLTTPTTSIVVLQ